jgi:hypothetical protein
MPLAAVQDSLHAWPAQAVRDTVAAIVRDERFARDVTQSFWQRVVESLGRLVSRLLAALPDWRIGNAVIVTAAVVLVLLVVARVVLRQRAERELWAGEPREGWRGRRLDPWTEAERLAGTGEFLQAAHALCAALLTDLASRGEVRLHPSKTTGDYARELRRRGASSERGFVRFRSRYDRLVYDAQACDAEDYAALLADARPLLADARSLAAPTRAA